MEAHEANLAQKRLSELELEWGNVSNLSRTRAHEKEVLNELKPQNDTLEQLKIVLYGGIEFPNWVGDHSFLRLTKVSIDSCGECTSLPRLGQLPSLKELLIRGMTKVKSVGREFLGAGLAFPSLEILSFDSMPWWEEWSTNSGVEDAAFPCLQELSIENCPNLVKVTLEALPSVRVLKLTKCGHGVLRSLADVASSVKKLVIDDISGLTDELWRVVIGYLPGVEEIYFSHCNEIRYLWDLEAEASKFLVNLRKLCVWECSNFVSLGEKEEDNCGSNLTSLRILVVSDCNSLERCCCPENLEDLTICNCDSLTSVSYPTGGAQKLKSLDIFGCKKLSEKELDRGGEKTRGLINSSMLMLEDVDLNDWRNLKSMGELRCFIHLTTLRIKGCTSMESFPDHELLNLTSLRHLDIIMCTSIDYSFPRGRWPPKLRILGIGGLRKPMSEWGPQNFPTSLVELRLFGGPYDDDVRSFDQLSHLLPSSLTTLFIIEFEKLESVSTGLQHLTSLQYLFIFNCPKTIDLPEKLLPTLLGMKMKGCPDLKERTSKGGSYWPLVSLVPRFETEE